MMLTPSSEWLGEDALKRIIASSDNSSSGGGNTFEVSQTVSTRNKIENVYAQLP